MLHVCIYASNVNTLSNNQKKLNILKIKKKKVINMTIICNHKKIELKSSWHNIWDFEKTLTMALIFHTWLTIMTNTCKLFNIFVNKFKSL